MRILVTGGAGFIGSHIAAYYASRAEVRVLDNLRTGRLENLKGIDCEFIEGSVTSKQDVKTAMKNVDYVFHLAAMVSVPESMKNPEECIAINTQGTMIVLQEAAGAGVKKLCFSSSAAIYGDNPTVPKVETMLPEPKSPYAVTKLDGEYYCGIFSQEGWLRTACMRYFNVFGPRQDPGSAYAAAVPIFIHRALRNEPLTIFGDGEQTRDFIFVEDIVAANVFLAEHPDLSGVYNVAYGQRQTINEIAHKMIDQIGSSSEIRYDSPRAGDVKHSQASIDKITAAGFAAAANFDRGLAETIDYFRSRRNA